MKRGETLYDSGQNRTRMAGGKGKLGRFGEPRPGLAIAVRTLFAELVGRHRTIPYQGAETVLDVLQRVGGITPGAEPTEIYVVRSHIGDLQRPEVFHVDLEGIVIDRDHHTNIRVRPYDQIYVG